MNTSRFLLALALLATVCGLQAQVALPPEPAGPGLIAAYYPNTDLAGDPAQVRVDAGIDFDWGAGAPAGLPANGFSVRWVGELIPAEDGTYDLIATSDDRVRVWLGGSLVIDSWKQSGRRELLAEGQVLEAGRPYQMVVEYADLAGDAAVELAWRRGARGREVVPTELWDAPSAVDLPVGAPSGDGPTATFHLGKGFDAAPVLSRVDHSIDFDWRSGSPDPAVPADGFSVRWVGTITPAVADAYQLIARSDDGVRVFVDDISVIDH